MRYLREYNENRVDLDKLRNFCEDSLIYLLDGDFRMRVYDPGSSIGRRKLNDYYIITLCKLGSSAGIYGDDIAINFNWYEIKDYYIPFLTRLNKNYNIKELSFYDGVLKNGNGELNIHDILSNSLKDDKQILQSVIKISK